MKRFLVFGSVVLPVVVLATACGSSAGGDAAPGAPDGGLSADGAAVDRAPHDAGGGALPDAGGGGADADTSTSPARCGATFCREAATCVNGACELPTCTGYQVPGGFATVQAAADAVGPGGGTICLAAGTFDEGVFLNAQEPVVLQGVSAAKTTVRSLYLSGSVTVKGLATTETSKGSSAVAMRFSNVRFASSSGPALVFTGNAASPPQQAVTLVASSIAGAQHGLQIENGQGGMGTLLVDGCDLSSKAGAAVWLHELTSSVANPPVTLTIQNSWIHDSPQGFSFTAVRGCASCPYPNTAVTDSITLVNDTFSSNGSAVRTHKERAGTSTLRIWNGLFTKNTLAIAVDAAVSAEVAHGLFSGNTTNYEGIVDGPGTVKADPLLDGASPPAPSAGSPARGAADPARAPAHDYWGRPRGTTSDVGAVDGD